MASPEWLIQMLTAKQYFQPCKAHSTRTGNGRNLFCMDCSENPICSYCCNELHNNHRVVQVRRSSHSEVIRASDVRKYIDTLDIQPYTINKAKIYFLKERPHKGVGRGAQARSGRNKECEICHRGISVAFRFCCLGCKLEWKNRGHQDVTFISQYSRQNATSSSVRVEGEAAEDIEMIEVNEDEIIEVDDEENPISSEMENVDTMDIENGSIYGNSASSGSFTPIPRRKSRKSTPRRAAT